jgi:hypothetical protein
MQTNEDYPRLAQSASTLGAGILGFGIGAKFAYIMSDYAIWIILIGAFLHVYGMYVVQLRNKSGKAQGIAKALWVSAWICLFALVALFIYLIIQKN